MGPAGARTSTGSRRAARSAAATAPSVRAGPLRPARPALRPRSRREPLRGREGPGPLRRAWPPTPSCPWSSRRAPRSASCSATAATPPAGRCPGAARRRSPTRWSPTCARWAARSYTGVRVRSRRRGAPDRVGPLRRDAAAVVGDLGPPLYGRVPARSLALPLWPRRLQGGLGARRPDPLDGRRVRARRDRPHRRHAGRDLLRRGRRLAGRAPRAAVRPPRPAEPLRPDARAGRQAHRLGLLPRPKRLRRST